MYELFFVLLEANAMRDAVHTYGRDRALALVRIWASSSSGMETGSELFGHIHMFSQN
jgi:hypothetical protein